MAKSVKAHTILLDIDKEIWAEGDFTPAFTNKLLKLYERFGIDLSVSNI